MKKVDYYINGVLREHAYNVAALPRKGDELALAPGGGFVYFKQDESPNETFAPGPTYAVDRVVWRGVPLERVDVYLVGAQE